MAKASGPQRPRRRFGRVRKLPSGRYQAGYLVPDGSVIYAEQTFPTKAMADRFLVLTEAEMMSGTWMPPERRRETVGEWANRWIESRTGLAARTAEVYRWLLDRHIIPVLGHFTLADLSPEDVRAWYAGLDVDHHATAAKAYRLLSSVMKRAVDDGILARSPCQIPGGGSERAPARPLATMEEVDALTDALPERLQIIVPLAVWCQLRRGEILGLQRQDFELDKGVLHIVRTRTTMMNGTPVVKGPKTAAGSRTIAIPPPIIGDIDNHLSRFVAPVPAAWVVAGEKGGPLQASHLETDWRAARLSVARPDLHLHDLRHTGLTWAEMSDVVTGASFDTTRERFLAGTSGFRVSHTALRQRTASPRTACSAGVSTTSA